MATRIERDCDTSTGLVRTIRTIGGQVVVAFEDGRVCLVSAVPTSGFAVSVDRGPDRLSVTLAKPGARAVVDAYAEGNRTSVRQVVG
ncbi:hypothetical protein ACFC5X_19390 [Streptomyces sp. NPDC055952]|uniref:hypothetical protein n=1 Tax=Streptomyces sp. NPDC055952 TaxID=3345663 RepID=UPI0035DB0562